MEENERKKAFVEIHRNFPRPSPRRFFSRALNRIGSNGYGVILKWQRKTVSPKARVKILRNAANEKTGN